MALSSFATLSNGSYRPPTYKPGVTSTPLDPYGVIPSMGGTPTYKPGITVTPNDPYGVAAKAAAALPAPQPGNQNQPNTNGTDPYNLNNDAGYGRAYSQFLGGQGGAASDFLSQVEQSLLGFGSQSLAQKYLAGIMPELEQKMQAAGTLGAGQHVDLNPYYESFFVHDANGNRVTDANGNPVTIDDRNQGFSQLAQLNRNAWASGQQGINANRLANLTYSSAGQQALQNIAYANQANLNNAATAENNALGQFLSGYRNTLQSQQDSLNNAADSAYNRLVQIALQNGTDPGASPNPNPPPKPPPSGTAPFVYNPKVTANPTGASARKKGGIYSIH